MEKMQIVIDIPDDMWEKIQEGYVPLGISKYLKNGIVLPEQHGDLIDKNDIQEITLEDSLHIMTYKKGGEVDCEIDAPTILKGTK